MPRRHLRGGNPLSRTLVLISLLAARLVAVVSAGQPRAAARRYTTEHDLWRASANGFAAWQLVRRRRGADSVLRLDVGTAAPETDPYAAAPTRGGNYYNGGSYLVGEAVSPRDRRGAASPRRSRPGTPSHAGRHRWVETLDQRADRRPLDEVVHRRRRGRRASSARSSVTRSTCRPTRDGIVRGRHADPEREEGSAGRRLPA